VVVVSVILRGVDMGKLGSHHKNRSKAALYNYRRSEVKRLLHEGLSISKISKMLDIDYKLAKRLASAEGPALS